MKKLLIMIISLFMGISAPTAGQIELSLKDLCEQSDIISTVRVLSTQSYFAEKETRILTDIELQILQIYKGQFNSSGKITITTLGGTINGTTTFMINAPAFRVGEESILFLQKVLLPNNESNYVVSGLSQGKYNIFIDATSGTTKVTREQVTVPLKLESGSSPILLTNKDAIRLQNFVNHINYYLNN